MCVSDSADGFFVSRQTQHPSYLRPFYSYGQRWLCGVRILCACVRGLCGADVGVRACAYVERSPTIGYSDDAASERTCIVSLLAGAVDRYRRDVSLTMLHKYLCGGARAAVLGQGRRFAFALLHQRTASAFACVQDRP